MKTKEEEMPTEKANVVAVNAGGDDGAGILVHLRLGRRGGVHTVIFKHLPE